MITRDCPTCGDSFTGRPDKKFCSDRCRNNFNNLQNSNVTNYVRRVNNALRKNRLILQEFEPVQKITRTALKAKGFDFELHTSLFTNKNSRTYFYCYEFGYMLLDNDLVQVVKKA